MVSAATLAAARNPRMRQARFDWTVSRLQIQPVTEDIARAGSKLLARQGLHGHEHAIDAMVAATALAAPGPAAVLTSDPRDLGLLCAPRVRFIKV